MPLTQQKQPRASHPPVHNRVDLDFPGFSAPTSNTTFTPNQFFDACIPYSSRGVVRLVAYLIRRTLGWCDPEGNPQEEEIAFSYGDLVARAGISRDMVRQAIDEAVAGHFIECVTEGRVNTAGETGNKSVYRLRWDPSLEYRKKPVDFRGFFEGDGNRTDIPNQFFDVVIPTEPLSVIKVVGAVIRFSIGFQAKHGRRRQQVALSYKAIERYTRMGSPSDLNKALRTALARNYLVRLESGVFSHRGDIRRPAVYAIRWADDWHSQKNIAGSERSEIHSSHGQKNEAAEESEIHSSIQTKPENEISKQQAVHPDSKIALLRRVGFGQTTAEKLAQCATLESIQRQIDWLEKRGPSRNRLGLLRTAIEQDWLEPPEVGASQLAGTPGFELARHFYATFGGNQSEPVSIPSTRDCQAAGAFIDRLHSVAPTVTPVEAGRALGQLARAQQNPFPSLQLALRQVGDPLFVRLKSEYEQSIQAARDREQDRLIESLAAGYESFLRREEQQIQTERPREYSEFLSHRASERERISRDPLWSRSPRWLELFDAESRRLSDLQSFFKLPTLAQWKTTSNPSQT